ncbi:MAG: uracil-DNA glycosylase [Methylococcaceae bacterium]
MDNVTRLQYLEAMGIDVWMPRVSAHDRQSLVSDAVDQCADAGIPAIESWDLLQREVANCTKCPLCKSRSQTVFGSGTHRADWLLIGEGPGQHEDEQGLPFVGKAGVLLTEMLRAIGLAREDVFITNIVKCRPPNNRDPHPDEIESCNNYLQRQIALIEPKIILAIGRIAAQTLLNTDAPLSRLRGKVYYLNNTQVVVIYHPAYLLRSLLEKRKAWQDLQFAMQTLKEIEGR